MAQIWKDIGGSMNNTIKANTLQSFLFHWFFVTFSGEAQEAAEVRWRKAGHSNIVATSGIRGLMKDDSASDATMWSAPVAVGRFEDTNTWTLSGGQFVPPADASRRYSNIEQITFPNNFFSEGVWIFGARMKPVGQDWSGWVTHKVEISAYDDRQNFVTSAAAVTKGPGFDTEGLFGLKVEVMSAAGITAESPEVTFNVWETDKFLKESGGNVVPVPESRYGDAGIIGRVTRK